jgi:hypothetical protein
MKQEDLKRLKEICDREGFEVLNEPIDEDDKFVVLIKKQKPKVEADGGNIDSGHFYFVMNNSAKDKCRNIGCWNVTEFLSSQLEQFLNEK